MRNFWHTNCPNWRSCAIHHPSLPKNEKFLAHKLPKLKIVCHASSILPKKWEIIGTQIAQIGDRVPLLTNLRRKMSNRKNRRRRVVIYRASSEQDTFKNVFHRNRKRACRRRSCRRRRGCRRSCRRRRDEIGQRILDAAKKCNILWQNLFFRITYFNSGQKML